MLFQTLLLLYKWLMNLTFRLFIILVLCVLFQLLAYQYPGYWKEAVILCKAVSDSYLLGNVDLTDVDQACSVIQGQLNGPSWLGIAKETYISTDGGNSKDK